MHRHGALLFAQINHCGRQVVPRSVGLAGALSASAVKEPVLGTRPRPLTVAEIGEVVGSYARQFKRSLVTPILCAGGWQNQGAMERAITKGGCDAVSSARAMIADPFLVRHLKEGTKGPRCVFCNECAGVVGGLPVDCYHPEVRPQKDRMLAAAGLRI